MKITNLASEKIFFKDVKEGSVFETNGSYYMKICINCLKTDVSRAVDLANGNTVSFHAEAYVVPVNCELVIK